MMNGSGVRVSSISIILRLIFLQKILIGKRKGHPMMTIMNCPFGRLVNPPLKGTIKPSGEFERDSDYYPLSTPKNFIYKAMTNRVGQDSFSLNFGGAKDVQFIVNIINLPDKPVLKTIRTISGLGFNDDPI